MLDIEVRESLPNSACAFAKDRKEPLTNGSHVQNPLARFNQVESISHNRASMPVKPLANSSRRQSVGPRTDDDSGCAAVRWRHAMVDRVHGRTHLARRPHRVIPTAPPYSLEDNSGRATSRRVLALATPSHCVRELVERSPADQRRNETSSAPDRIPNTTTAVDARRLAPGANNASRQVARSSCSQPGDPVGTWGPRCPSSTSPKA
jgi:hypothetical protein